MKFLWRETLRRMTGDENRCPVCRSPGLVVYDRDERDVLPDIRGVPYCECHECASKGDFAELVARGSGHTLADAVRELLRIGELEASGRDVDTYIARKEVQTAVDLHFDKCVSKLREAPHLGNIRAGLSISTIRQLPPDTGMFVPADAPQTFAILSAARYARVPMTLYRYRFDGETTCIDAQNPKTLQREHRLRVTGDVGVYLGDYRNDAVPDVLLATNDPRTAGQLYGALRAESSLPPPVIGIAGFPLPNRFATVKTIYLLDAPDSQLPLAFAIQALRTPLIYGKERGPQIRVLAPRCPVSGITAEDVRRLSNATMYGSTLRAWLQGKLLALKDRREEIANALLQAGASENVRADVVEILGQDAPKELVDTIMLPTAEPDDILTLGNGKLVKNTPVGIYTAHRNRKTCEIVTKSLLCNVGITVESRIVNRGYETAVCTISHPDNDVPAVSVKIPHSHWNNPDALAEDIRSAYAENGRTPYVAFYRVSGYGWSDLLQLLGSHCPVQSGIRALGATQDGAVNLPNMLIAKGITAKQTKASLLDKDALAAYSALNRDADPHDDSRLESFLSSRVSLDRVGVAAGVLHTLFCTAGKLFDQSGVRRPPAHLLFVETEPGVWDTTLRTLAYLFSGSEYVPPMDYADRDGFLRAWSDLGTLPLITRLPAADDMATVLAASPVSVIAVIDPLTAMSCSGRGSVSFVLPNVETASADEIAQEEVTGLRRAFVSIATAMAGSGWLDISSGGPVSLSTPCLSALGSLSAVRDNATVAGGLYRSVKGRYPGIGLTGAKAFFSVLHRAHIAVSNGDTGGVKITTVPGPPADALRASFNDRGEHIFILQDQVLVSRSVVQLINRQQAFLFDAEQLSREFAENGIILPNAPTALGIDGRRVWVFPRTVWESEVVRAVGFTSRKETE